MNIGLPSRTRGGAAGADGAPTLRFGHPFALPARLLEGGDDARSISAAFTEIAIRRT